MFQVPYVSCQSISQSTLWRHGNWRQKSISFQLCQVKRNIFGCEVEEMEHQKSKILVNHTPGKLHSLYPFQSSVAKRETTALDFHVQTQEVRSRYTVVGELVRPGLWEQWSWWKCHTLGPWKSRVMSSANLHTVENPQSAMALDSLETTTVGPSLSGLNHPLIKNSIFLHLYIEIMFYYSAMKNKRNIAICHKWKNIMWSEINS